MAEPTGQPQAAATAPLWCWCCAVWGLTAPAFDGRTRLCVPCGNSTRAECKARHMAKALALTPDAVRLGW